MSLDIISPNLTEDHFLEIIRKKGGDRFVSWAFEGGAAKKGDAYLSEVYKVVIKGLTAKDEEIKVNLIIKATPKSVGRRKTFRSSEFFRNEINFYNVIAKGFQEFQAVKTDAKYPFTEISSCLLTYIGENEHDFLILDSLTPAGYETVPRQESMIIHICRLILRTLGRFHAMSFVIRDQSPKLFEEMTAAVEETYYAKRLLPWYKDFIKTQIDIALDSVKKAYGGTEIEEKAIRFLTDGCLYDKMVNFTHTRNRYSVIGHGDCWTPNFLLHFTKVDGYLVPVQAKMIDFQLTRYASPVLDISFFIYSCTDEALRSEYYDDLIETYYSSLSELIKDMGSNPEYLFPRSALENELKTYFRFGVGMGIESIPFSFMDDSETADLDTIEGNEAIPITSVWVLKKPNNEQDLHRLADIFKHSVDCGYLD